MALGTRGTVEERVRMQATRDRSCTGKHRYTTRKGAKARVHRVPKLKGLRPYKCAYCEFWHLGHSSARAREAMRAQR